MTPTVADAAALAERAHAGQVDKAGRPYVEHVRAVAGMLHRFGENAVMAGWLHDTVEDTWVTLAYLREQGYPEEVVGAVDSVSRRPGEAYEDMLDRAVRHPVGLKVKLADNSHNSDPKRQALLSEDDRTWGTRKYAAARSRLVARNPELLEAVERTACRYRIDSYVLVRDGYWDGPNDCWLIRESAYCGKRPPGYEYSCELHREHIGPCLEID
ncbi:HD domain-containing protein [Plantactinospora sp. S1510]|uniref:HD domain-containing protein n=1 Tax=Plantactinospora alkalitolerans TaxID=2789879 RepID=A0ABS0H9L6_9ACTN|nr:HD domain-containing protein [Plantactinospora alkalitolerans]MBF9135160.1 HD domain-containing protein [Plantactinospora alkalitolerans]